LHERDERFELVEGESLRQFLGHRRSEAEIDGEAGTQTRDEHAAADIGEKFAALEMEHDGNPERGGGR